MTAQIRITLDSAEEASAYCLLCSWNTSMKKQTNPLRRSPSLEIRCRVASLSHLRSKHGISPTAARIELKDPNKPAT